MGHQIMDPSKELEGSHRLDQIDCILARWNATRIWFERQNSADLESEAQGARQFEIGTFPFIYRTYSYTVSLLSR